MVLVFCLNCLDVFINILKVISRTPYSIMKSIFLNVKNKTKIHFLSLQFSTFLPFCPCKFFFSLCKMRLFYLDDGAVCLKCDVWYFFRWLCSGQCVRVLKGWLLLRMADIAGLAEAAGARFSSLELIGQGSFGDVYKG